MAVKLLKQADKRTWRPCWYGAFDVDGKRRVVNLGVKWHGEPPASGSLRDPGDADFEASREEAKDALAKFRDEARRKGNAAHLVERLIEAKTGRAVKHVKIVALANHWLSGTRRGLITQGHAKVSAAMFERFRRFMVVRNPKAVYLYEVTTEDVAAYIEDLRRELAPRTARGHAALLRSAFKRFLPVGSANPFDGQEFREKAGVGTVHRKPFTAVELQALIEAANGDDMMRDLITAAACTGMRRGDVCRLRWSAVDMAGGMVDAKASKTGEPIEVPLFDPLRRVLEARVGNGSPFVFPEAAQMIEQTPVRLSYRFKLIVAKAMDGETSESLPEVIPTAEIEAEGVDAIRAQISDGPRRERVLENFRRYCAGESVKTIERAVGCSRSTVSVDLNTVQNLIKKRFMPTTNKLCQIDAVARVTRVERPQGQRAASIRDWHALRTTFVTLALTANVPMELVRRVTGHATVDVVLRHYFQPGREEFKAALAGALPAVLTGGKAGAPVGRGQLAVGSEQRQGAGHVPGDKGASKDAGKKASGAGKPGVSAAQELAGLAAKLADGSASEADRARLRELAAGV